MGSVDNKVRYLAFEFLEKLSDTHGDVLPFTQLSRGFDFEGNRVPLLGPQGIFKPKVIDLPISITTAPNGPYKDTFSKDGFLLYKYRGTDPAHRDNVGLRQLKNLQRPLIYLHGVMTGRYVAAWPVFVIDDNPQNHTFTVAVDDKTQLGSVEDFNIEDASTAIRRRYVTRAVQYRLHQRTFRERVLKAYREQCAICRLRHGELLEAAHIVADSDPDGEPLVSNGLALCKLHHAAFDKNILGINPDFVTEIRLDILNEIDGPMLKFGLQAMHGTKVYLPRNKDQRPDVESLAKRYEKFLSA